MVCLKRGSRKYWPITHMKGNWEFLLEDLWVAKVMVFKGKHKANVG